jgi:hypothetical protein
LGGKEIRGEYVKEPKEEIIYYRKMKNKILGQRWRYGFITSMQYKLV